MKKLLIASFAALFAAALTTSHAAAPAKPAVFPGSLPVFLSNESVASDLGLSKSQRAKIESIRAEYKAGSRRIASEFPKTAADKKSANEAIGQLNAKCNREALAVLTLSQAARAEEIGHQTLGGLMLHLPKIQRKLALTPAQVAALKKLSGETDAFVSRVNKDFEAGKIDIQERLASLRVWRQKTSAKIMRLLTPEQKKNLQGMKGKQFQPA